LPPETFVHTISAARPAEANVAAAKMLDSNLENRLFIHSLKNSPPENNHYYRLLLSAPDYQSETPQEKANPESQTTKSQVLMRILADS
jgi:hypothetical protein